MILINSDNIVPSQREMTPRAPYILPFCGQLRAVCSIVNCKDKKSGDENTSHAICEKIPIILPFPIRGPISHISLIPCSTDVYFLSAVRARLEFCRRVSRSLCEERGRKKGLRRAPRVLTVGCARREKYERGRAHATWAERGGKHRSISTLFAPARTPTKLHQHAWLMRARFYLF